MAANKPDRADISFAQSSLKRQGSEIQRLDLSSRCSQARTGIQKLEIGTSNMSSNDPDCSDVSFAQSSLRRLGSGIQRLDLSARYSQARTSIQKLEIGTKFENGRQRIGHELRARNIDGQRAQASLASLLDVSQRLVGEAKHRVDSSLQERLGGASQQEDLEALQRRLRDDQQEMKATKMMQESEEACKDLIKSHLLDFIAKNPKGSYEQWLRELHPENDYEGKLLEGFTELDHRFYVKESDHLIMWNESLGGVRQSVNPRSRIGGLEQDTQVVDLLGFSDSSVSRESGGDESADALLHFNRKPEKAESAVVDCTGAPSQSEHIDRDKVV